MRTHFPEQETVLVTGGAGYIGSNVALALLDAGKQVVILDNLSTGNIDLIPPGACFIQGSCSNSDLVRELIHAHKVRQVMHLAASISVEDSMSEPDGYYWNNLAQTIALAATARQAGVSAFLFSSTAAVYGEGNGRPLRETDPVRPINPYGRSKAMAELALRDIAAASNMGVGVLRYFNVAGADPHLRSGQCSRHPHHLIEIATQVATGRRDRLTIFGTDYPTPDGTAVRDYVHVCDVADAHVRLARLVAANGGYHLFNAGAGAGTSVAEVVEALEQELGSQIAKTEGSRRIGDPAALCADTARLQTTLNWRPQRSQISQLVRDALAWERHRSIPRAA